MGTRAVTVLKVIIPLLGFVMVIYWSLYFWRGMPGEGIPWLSESLTAALALITGIGLWLRRSWALPCVLALGGMWAYGVIGGIQLVIENGLNFESPFGAMTDALLFPLILMFSIYMIILFWRNRRTLE